MWAVVLEAGVAVVCCGLLSVGWWRLYEQQRRLTHIAIAAHERVCVYAAKLIDRERARALAERAGEREAAAMLIEAAGHQALAAAIRNGSHLTRLTENELH